MSFPPSPSLVKEVRAILGCGLREAYDFCLNHGKEHAVEKAQQKAASLNGKFYESPEEKCREAVRSYYRALDNREHGGVAQDKAFTRIEQALGMSWSQWQMDKAKTQEKSNDQEPV
jgi:hypothetical protein